MKIGKYDVGPMIDKGQKHWTTVAPIVTPLVSKYTPDQKPFAYGDMGVLTLVSQYGAQVSGWLWWQALRGVIDGMASSLDSHIA